MEPGEQRLKKLLIYLMATFLILLFSGCSKNNSSIDNSSGDGVLNIAISPCDNPSLKSGNHIYLQNIEILKAIKKGDKKQVKQLVSEHPEVIDSKGYLEYKLELDNGNIDIKSRLATPLIASILTGNNDIAYMLIKLGANIRETGEVEYSSNIDGVISGSGPEIWSPLFAAVQTENTHIAKILIESGANMNVRGTVGRSLLHIAVNKGKHEMVEMLLEKGADVNACDSYGSTPITSALTTSPEIVGILKKAGAKGVERFATDEANEILSAIVDGNTDKVKMLVTNDIKLVNSRGHIDYSVKQGTMTKNYISGNATPLLLAAISGKTDIAKFLMEKGAKIDRRSQVTYAMTDNEKSENFSSFDWTPLIGAVSAGNPDMAKLLLSGKAKIDATNSKGLSPLLIAIRDGNIDLAEILLSAGADFNARDSSGSSAMEQANRMGDHRITDLIRRYGKKKSADSNRKDVSVTSAEK